MVITNSKLYYRVIVIKNKQKHGTSKSTNILSNGKKLRTWI